MKMTVLEIVKDILSDMDSDAVNSINDTVESLQVAQILQTTYFNIIDGKDWPWLYNLFQLNASGTVAKPTHMQLPVDIIEVSWLKYNKKTSTETRTKFADVSYKTPEEFMKLTNEKDSSSSTIQVVTDYSGLTINIQNNKAPQYFTSFDDEYLVFDSFDNTVDSTLQASKSQCFGKRYPTFTMADNFTPDMPVQSFSHLLNETKSVSFLTLKQAQNPKAEQHSISQRRRMSQEAWRIKKGITYPDYGRK